MDGGSTQRRVVAVAGLTGGLIGVAEGVAEEFLDDDDFDVLFQEEGGGRVAEVVEADAAEAGLAEECGEGSGEVGRVDRSTHRSGDHVPAALPRGPPGGSTSATRAASGWRRPPPARPSPACSPPTTSATPTSRPPRPRAPAAGPPSTPSGTSPPWLTEARTR